MSLINHFYRRASTTTLGITATLAILLLVSCWVIDPSSDTAANGHSYQPVVAARAGDLTITITESASLQARQSVSLSSGLPSNKAKILYLADEGSLLAKGDVIARFDPSPIEDEISKLESDILEAQANIQQARAELVLLETEFSTKVGRLEQKLEASRVKWETYQSTEFPGKKAFAEKKLHNARTEYDLARRQLDTERKLLEKALTKEENLEKAVNLEKQQKTELDIATREFENLMGVVLPSELEEAKLNYEHSEKELENYTNIIYKQKIIKQKADVTRYESRLVDLQQSLEQAKKHLTATTLRAPVSGQLLFKRISIGNEKRRVQVGDTLWNRQQFAELPDMSRMIARLGVREADISKLREGQRATVFPEAYPNLHFTGAVAALGTLASDSNSETGNYFEVRILLDDVDPRLRPGMSAKVVIHAKRYKDTVYVPVEAVFYLDQKPVCFLWRGGNPEAVPVTLGDSDGRHIAILSGLKPGDNVSLVFPDAYSS